MNENLSTQAEISLEEQRFYEGMLEYFQQKDREKAVRDSVEGQESGSGTGLDQDVGLDLDLDLDLDPDWPLWIEGEPMDGSSWTG